MNHATPSADRQSSPHRVAVLGATGSIGTATVDVISSLHRVDPEQPWQMWAVSGHRQVDSLVKIADAAAPRPERLVLSCPEAAQRFSTTAMEKRYQIGIGPDALIEVASCPEVDTVVAAIVGRAGLESTLAGIEAGKRVALANKETMVVAGPLVKALMEKSGAELLPVDSEHSAIFQALGRWASPGIRCSKEDSVGRTPPPARPKKLILTASGGPFRTWSTEEISAATPQSALAHPTWEMGAKITVDSATMMNKALEVIEARWLFEIPADQIEVVVHPQSIVHSMVEFEDGSVIAQMSPPDMRLPIQYALTYPRRLPCPAAPLDRTRSWDLSFEVADRERFPALDLGFEVAKAGGSAGAVLNAANEVAVGLFLDEKIRFTDIVAGCRDVLAHHDHETHPTLTRLLQLDRWARDEMRSRFKVTS